MIKILLVEDSPTDVAFVTEALGEMEGAIDLEVIPNGTDAIAYLDNLGAAQMPSLVILDLNLPGCRGDRVLQHIKQGPLKAMPVVMMTSSKSDADILNCYEQHANCYIVKPLELDDFFAAIHSLKRFWIDTAALPDISVVAR